MEAVPLVKYADHNLRVCLPFSISSEDLSAVIAKVISPIGDSYDSSHLLALGRFLAPLPLIPKRWLRKAHFAGLSSSRAVICSTLVARAFIHVRYPILPFCPGPSRFERKDRIFPYGRRFRSIHLRFILPRDFDLSPYFRFVKFNQMEKEASTTARLSGRECLNTRRGPMHGPKRSMAPPGISAIPLPTKSP
jgi:hypothetical protein